MHTRGRRGQSQCSFCGKGQDEVQRLIAGPENVSICNECVALCNEIIGEEAAAPAGVQTAAGQARQVTDGRRRVSSGTVWEDRVGYSRAVRAGNQIFVSGTTATDGAGELVGGDDPEAQATFIIEKIGGALEALGSSLADVVRTRVYVTRAADWEAVGRAHARAFGATRPANTLVEVGALVGPGYLVEIDVDAVVTDGDQP